MILVLCFQFVVSLEYTLAEASTIIEELSAIWKKVLQHLNLVSRLPVYRFHMREVRITDSQICMTPFTFVISLHFLAKYTQRVFPIGYSLPSEAFHHPLCHRSLLVIAIHDYIHIR